jgi:signal transduction histidine kinase
MESNTIADELKIESQQLVQNQGFELQWYQHPQLPPIFADAKYVKAAFLNLLTNALKYSDKEKRILVRWTLVDWRKQRALAISVQDFGMGIHPSDQKKIVKPFYRTDEVKAKQIRGNGLGLHLVKRWIEAHDGDIELESKPGLGSTFTLFIPI